MNIKVKWRWDTFVVGIALGLDKRFKSVGTVMICLGFMQVYLDRKVKVK
ncbi:hypothetical protein [Aneurinibacillus aneurinilyticus]|uniref:Uncharacterized protein n=1 Tax=Aneurinibacillus aneurinilyticus ATCC 12856 TaxID=649747 RepID=U1YHK1_ANEAE|nr:hypothetical protein [Aneurinibacillus aneurinilyticus]ERI10246.1 hypothetical protein HMPREF0083_01690 [Aneurinibacillus aneurinilyticus ATCC 12856]MED0705873.1 hypothetical protein [Aneurinibacillus aneurinilyticus]MED0722738.1 hypothetical protein [Aneurinibacillus aneurinilyticus]MED0731428.1 hypothetical protein [Aneurinibacillus aneurinilyticus]MED0740184.1 hypothetical protein [Aneurinibacillus aneurinilyticus]